MLKFKGRLRIINIFLFVFIIIFAIVVVVIIIKEDEETIPYQSDLLKNIVELNDINLLYLIDNSTFINLKSKQGNVNIIDYNIDLLNLNVKYTSKDFIIYAEADKGQYISQRFLKAYDNIIGNMDNMTFKTGNSGVLEYDYMEGKGIIKNWVTMYQENNSISSKYVEFDVKNNYIIFKDNVTVNYISDKE